MEKNYEKAIRRLKYSVISLLCCALFCLSQVRAENIQRTGLRVERLDSYLKKIELAYQVSFVYDANQINKGMPIEAPQKLVSINSDLEPLREKGIDYNIMGKQVILKKIPVVIREKSEIIVKGHVRSKKDNDYLPGVSVREKGIKNAVSSNNQGEYQIRVKENATLVFSFIGYKTVEVVVGGKTVIDVALEEDAGQLKEVNIVSTGYQDLNKKLFTGAATSLKGSDVKRDGITDVSRMLEGRVAGVSVQNVSGTFGAAPKIRVRGATSISGDNKPLWVVDGVVLEDVVNISNEQLSTGDANTLIGSSVAGLNPDDIESFNILKDAAATAQYGARAMNGVVVVTTKKGRNTEGKPLVSYTGNFSTYLKPSYNNFDILNSADQMNIYLELQNKGWLNQGVTANNANGGVFTKMYNEMYKYDPATDTYALRNDAPSQKAFLQRYANANTNWFDVLFKNSLLMEHSLSVTSGTEKSQFYASTSFLNDNGWTIGDGVKRFTGNLRGTFKLSDKLSFELLTQGSVRDQKAPGTLGRNSNPVFGQYDRDFDINPFSYALNTSRVLTPYDANGNLEYFTRDFAPFNIISELQNNTLGLTQIDFKGQLGVKYKITSDLQYSFDGAYRFAKTNQEHKITENSNQANAYRAGIKEQNSTIIKANRFLYKNPDNPNALPVSVLPFGGFYNTVDDNITNYYFRNAVEWNKTYNEDHLLNIYAAQELRYINRQHKTFDGYGYQYDQGGVPFIDPNIVKQNVESNFNYYSMRYNYERYLNYSARAAYSYKGKYAINATGRYDGSNLLGESTTARWLPTWNVSGSWNIDTEDFMKKSSISKTINRATLRATYGLTASIGNASNSSLVLQARSTRRPYLSEKETALYIAGLENSQLTFEKQKEFNLGLDLGFWNDRLTLTVDAYDRRGFDLIGPIRTGGIGGEEIKIANYADMRSKGIEATIGATIFQRQDWGWKTQLNFAHNTSKITNLQNQPLIFDLVGPDGGAQLGYPQRGLFSIDFQGLTHDTGVPQFINEDGVKSTNVYLQSNITKYLKYEGPVDPTLSGGFYNAFRYKSFSFSALVTFSAGNKVRLNPIFKTNNGNVSFSDLDAMPSVFLNRWVMPGDENRTNMPSILDIRNVKTLDGYPYNNYNYSTERVADGGFVRLKTVSLSYAFNPALVGKFGLKNASLSAVANNVLLIYSDKALNGQDPEFFGSGGVALPIPRQFTLSLKVGF
ncbi:SusC/RagA family TonB-linked outer membrane protein [Pedobacter nutrimenti]|jgi:TonB-linked SusC/RagA family outer membrane protein|uniref:TonB-linked SusC/RagA family outer membrane protein n=1 Tax=Pedobacter nutrimenti TaxID=1241337 RepID=A0A318UWR2_9SPHI|nr:SusC/RagA family TonB-linked outer membrane protein [Pedobacter nutrimenti]PYF76089.1 TonB-linked SusC/RagA family outer membrane protein [Pedobacter nutrimenti]